MSNTVHRKNKYKYTYVVQGYYAAYGWEDLCQSEKKSEAQDDIKSYRTSAPETMYRIVQRRELNS